MTDKDYPTTDPPEEGHFIIQEPRKRFLKRRRKGPAGPWGDPLAPEELPPPPPVASPPTPEWPPPPPPEEPKPPLPPAIQAQVARTRRTVLAAIGGLLSICVLATLAVSWIDEALSPDDVIVGAGSVIGTRDTDWQTWTPPASETRAVEASPSQVRYAREIAAVLFPDYTVEEVLFEPGGGYDAVACPIPDHYLVRARRDATICFDFWAPHESWKEERVLWRDSALEERCRTAWLDEDLRYAFDPSPLGLLWNDSLEMDLTRLVNKVERQWPGGAVSLVCLDFPDRMEGATVRVTTWDTFARKRSFTGVEAHYAFADDGEWALDEWDYVE
jgi:hypothetical protein